MKKVYKKTGKSDFKLRVPVPKPGGPHGKSEYDRKDSDPCNACGFGKGERCKLCEL